MIRLVLLSATLAASACATMSPGPAIRDVEPTRARAALASLVVDNQSAQSITIAYRHASRPNNEVSIGDVGARDRAEMAPVPAGEPIILVARNSAGLQFVLPARTFDVDGSWTWTVPANARFVRVDSTEVSG